jgi:hypothetical protein
LTEVSTEYERLLDSSVRKGRAKLRNAPLPNAAAINQCCVTLLLGTNAASVDEAMRQRAALNRR